MKIMCIVALVWLGLAPNVCFAQEPKHFQIVIKDHQFDPATLHVPAGEKIKLTVDNQDPTPEEFESHELNREKVIQGNRKGIIFLGPLKKGTYHYVGEFHEKTAQGVIVAE